VQLLSDMRRLTEEESNSEIAILILGYKWKTSNKFYPKKMKTLRRISDANKKLKSKQAIYPKFKNSNWKWTIITSMNEIIPWHFRWTHFDVPTTYISTKVVGVEQWRSKRRGRNFLRAVLQTPGLRFEHINE